MEVSLHRKPSRALENLNKLDNIVDWDEVVALVRVIDRTSKETGGCPHRDLHVKTKMLFVQYLYNLSDPELEDQVNDRLSFQQFVGVDFQTTVPDYSTIWRFKERLIEEGLLDKIFALVNSFLEDKNLFIKKGTMMDATIIESSNRPLSDKRREELEQNSSSQVDTDARSTKKRGKYYFGYKGHTGVDVGSKLIRKRKFTSANVHDSKEKEDLLSGDEQSVFGDSAYSNQNDKRKKRKDGVYYGVLDKANRGRKLSNSQKKRNKKKSKVRSAVEHPYGVMKTKMNYTQAVAKTFSRNQLRFDMNCIVYNLIRADFLLKRAA